MFNFRCFVVATLLLAMAGEPPAFAAQTAPSYQDDQAIDEKLGLLNRQWKTDLVNIRMRLDLPPQARAGFPPYDQQPEKAQNLPSQTRTCYNGQGVPIPC